jgi:hypothetical protein
MNRRQKDTMTKGMIGGTLLLMGRLCMPLVVERLTDGEIIIISVLYFDVSFKYALHLLNFEGTRCLMD